jgi:restriction endonuclease S subunit
MKKTTITVTFDEEKAAALRLFLEQKGMKLDAELESFITKLFKRGVPQNVQEYLELKDCVAPASSPKKPASPEKEQTNGQRY